MRWLTNALDPDRLDWIDAVIPDPGQSQLEAETEWRNYLKDKVIGDPKAAEKFTVKQLKEMGLVGVYLPERL